MTARTFGRLAAVVAAFIALVASNIALILANRSFADGLRGALRADNKVLWGLIGVTVALLVLVIAIAPLRRMFGFVVPGPGATALAVGVGGAVLAALLLHQRLAPWLQRAGGPASR